MLNSLSGKTALVTGASRGIGRASALALGKAGAQVLVHYACAEKEADAVAAEIRSFGGRAEKLAADLASKNGPHQLARQVRAIVGERLDILVANAGIAGPSPIEQTTIDDFEKLYALNVRAPYFLVQQLLPIMCKDSSVTLLSSLAARAAVGNLCAYATTKGAVATMMKYFAAALGSKGIRVNAVAPGVVETEMSSFTKTEAGREATLGMQALKRIAHPDDIGAVVVFLASEEARWITGATIPVDGGSKL
jgi:3-oxoacyl-[acyl-carrier protein] reductase